MTAKAWAGKAVNSALRPIGVQVISGRSTNPTNPAVKTFIPARETLAAARHAGLSVGDYIDTTFAEPGVTAATVKAMLDLSRSARSGFSGLRDRTWFRSIYGEGHRMPSPQRLRDL